MKKVNIAFSLVLTTLFSLLLLSSCDERQMTDKTPEFTVSRIGYGYDGCFFYVENGKVFAENILTGQTAEFYGEGISECFANCLLRQRKPRPLFRRR